MTSLPFSENDIKTLVAMWTTGGTASEIAGAIGRTRNAVLGKIHRLRNSGDLKDRVHGDLVNERRRAARVRHVERVKRPRKKAKSKPPVYFGAGEKLIKPSPFKHRDVDVVPLHIGLLDLTATTCRWPYGDGPITFCGCSCEESEPYCDGHAAIAFQPKVEAKKCKEAA